MRNQVRFAPGRPLDPRAAALAHYPAGHEEGWPDALANLVAEFTEDVFAHRRGERRETLVASFADAHRVMGAQALVGWDEEPSAAAVQTTIAALAARRACAAEWEQDAVEPQLTSFACRSARAPAEPIRP